MLRALAFRLRPGAEGVILVKPQFELPDRRVKAAGADSARLRDEALEKVRERARRRWGSRSSSISIRRWRAAAAPWRCSRTCASAGVRSRCRGRASESPPRRRARRRPRRDARGAALVRGRRAGAGRRRARRDRGVAGRLGIEAETGGVAWTGAAATGLRANLWSRVATRVLARVGEVEAREFGKLRHRAARLPWRAFIAPAATVAARASASHCRLYHTGALAEAAVLAVVDAVPGARAAKKDEPADVTLLVRGVDDRFMFSADASGDLLAPPRRPHRGRRGAAARDARRRAAGARRLAAGDGAGRPDVRRGDDRDRGGDAGDGPARRAPGARSPWSAGRWRPTPRSPR